MMQNSEWEVHPGTAEIQHVPCLHMVAVLSSVYSHCLFSGQRVSVPEVFSPVRGGTPPHWTVDRLGRGREEARDG